MERMKVAYVTCVALDTESNGGARCCRNHLRRLSQDEEIDLHAILIVAPGGELGARAVLDEFGVAGEVLVRNMDTCRPTGRSLREGLAFGLRIAVKHHWELEAMHQQAIDATIWHLVHVWEVRHVVFDYLFSCLFAPSIMATPTLSKVVVTLNREAEFNREMVDAGHVAQNPTLARISTARLSRLERRLHRQADRVIAIGPDDVPSGSDVAGTLLTPYLDIDEEETWRFDPDLAASVLFVGHAAHYPNRLAIGWIAQRLAPAVAARRPDIRFLVVGATSEQVPEEWRGETIAYLGPSDKATVDRLFRSAGLSICPVQNTFGMKFKLAEAIACGSPALASEESRRSVPYCESLPGFPLDRPEEAAELVCRLAGDRGALEGLSAAILADHRAFIISQRNVWSRTLRAGPG